VVSVGNTRTKFGLAEGATVQNSRAIANEHTGELTNAIAALSGEAGGVPVVMASVNDPVADGLEGAIAERLGTDLYRVGRDLQIPLALALDDSRTLGQDRMLNALGAFTHAKQACVVIDAGTAVTVDFVDGEGTFQGGVIAPGLGMMLRALHRQTAALPEVAFTPPDPARGPFGKDTSHAMLLGAQSAVRGLVRYVLEQYAEFYGAYPQVVATGGDSRVLFENDAIVEHLVPDLQLVGLAVACESALRVEDREGTDDE
jgi:type III pantothenate kinase